MGWDGMALGLGLGIRSTGGYIRGILPPNKERSFSYTVHNTDYNNVRESIYRHPSTQQSITPSWTDSRRSSRRVPAYTIHSQYSLYQKWMYM